MVGMKFTQPTTDDVIRFRAKTGLSQVDFGIQLYSSRRAVQNWEAGTIAMPIALWELAHYKLRPLLDAYEAERAGEVATRSITGA